MAAVFKDGESRAGFEDCGVRGMKGKIEVKEFVDKDGKVFRYVDMIDVRDWFMLFMYEQLNKAINQEIIRGGVTNGKH